MDWESLYGSYARYEERLREVERENYAKRVWASTHARRGWRGVPWVDWLRNLVGRGGSRQVGHAVHFSKLAATMPKQES